MTKTAIVPCFSTPLGVFISCPACKAKRLMRLYPETTGAGVACSVADASVSLWWIFSREPARTV